MEKSSFDIRNKPPLFSFKGRYSIKEYKGTLIKSAIVLFVLMIFVYLIFVSAETKTKSAEDYFGTFMGILAWVGIYIFIMASIKRFHDMNMSGIILVPIVFFSYLFFPIGIITTIVLFSKLGSKGSNMYGEDPLGNDGYVDKTKETYKEFLSDSHVKVVTNKKTSVSGNPKYDRIYHNKEETDNNSQDKKKHYREKDQEDEVRVIKDNYREKKQKKKKYLEAQNKLLSTWDKKNEEKRKPYRTADTVYSEKQSIPEEDLTEFQKMKNKRKQRNKDKTNSTSTKEKVQKTYISKFNDVLEEVRKQKEKPVEKAYFERLESAWKSDTVVTSDYGDKIEETENFSYTPDWNNSIDVLHQLNKDNGIDTEYFTEKETNKETNKETEKPIEKPSLKETKVEYTGEILDHKTPLKETKKLGNYKIFDGYAYFKDKKMYGADIESFDYIGVNYAKDKNNIYYQDRKIYGLDAATFRVVHGDFMEDKDNIYFRQNKIYSLDKATAKVLGRGYIRDKNTIYYQDRKVYGVDMESFKVVEDGKAEDKNNRYEGSTKLSK